MTVASRNHNSRVAHPDHGSIFAHNPVFSLESLTPNTCSFSRLDDGVVLLRDVAYPCTRVGEPLILGIARYRLDLRADIVPCSLEA
jgi:hypothetical protein